MYRSPTMYEPKITATKAGIEGGSATISVAIMSAVLIFLRTELGFNLGPELEGTIVALGAGLITGVFKAYRNWRKNA